MHEFYLYNGQTSHSSNSNCIASDMTCNGGCNKHSCGCLLAYTLAEETACMLTRFSRTAVALANDSWTACAWTDSTSMRGTSAMGRQTGKGREGNPERERQRGMGREGKAERDGQKGKTREEAPKVKLC